MRAKDDPHAYLAPDFPKCSLFFLDPLTDNEAARDSTLPPSDSDAGDEGDDSVDDEE